MSKLKSVLKSLVWRRRNAHNFTVIANEGFPLSLVTVGRGTYGSLHVVTFGGKGEGLRIGNYCSIAAGVTFLLSGEHRLDRVSTYPFKAQILHEAGVRIWDPIVVEDDVWIGYGATILTGVTIHRGSVIAAGALVTSDVPPYSIVGGVPAKIIRSRVPEELIEPLAKLNWSQVDESFVRENMDLLDAELSADVVAQLEKRLNEAIGAVSQADNHSQSTRSVCSEAESQ